MWKKKDDKEPRLAHCARCRRLYVRSRWNVCIGCLGPEEADHARIREELASTPDMSIEALAEKAQVTVACVLRMLGEGLIASADGTDHTCGQCGAPAISAKQRLCARCLMTLDRQLSTELRTAHKHREAKTFRGKAHGVLAMLRLKRFGV